MSGAEAARRAALAAGCILVAVAASGCEDTGARPTTTIQAPDSADQVLEGFSHFVTNDGIRRSRVEADTAYFYEGTQVTNLSNPKVTFYDLKGAESSTLTARSGVYRWQDGSMEANGNVVVVSPDGRRLTTDRLRYDNATNQISTDAGFGVTIERATRPRVPAPLGGWAHRLAGLRLRAGRAGAALRLPDRQR